MTMDTLHKTRQNILRSKKTRLSPTDEARKYCEKESDPDNFEKKWISKEIGFGLFTTSLFGKGDFLLEYSGNLVLDVGVEDEDSNMDYVYFFHFQGKSYIVDATNSKQYGRFVNDGVGKEANCKMRTICTKDGVPHLCLFATKIIPKGTELRYDYGVKDLPWRKKRKKIITKTEQEKIITETESVNSTAETEPVNTTAETAPVNTTAETESVNTTAETEPVNTTAETKPVNTTAETEPVNTTAETEPVNTTAETKPGNTIAETKPVNTTAETKPVNTTAETDPVYTTAETEPVNTIAETEPVNTTAETEPVNTTTETEPVNTTAETKPVNTTAETEPVNTTAETAPVNTIAETEPVNTTAETKPVNTTAETDPVYTTAETKPVNTTAETDPVYTTAETEPVNTTAETAPVNTTAETKPINTTAETEPVNTTAETEPVNTTAETEPVNTTAETTQLNTIAETEPVNTTAETEPVNTTAETEPVNTTAETKPGNTTAETAPVNTTAGTEPVNTTAETEPVNTTAETKPGNTTAETAPVNTTAGTGPVNTTAETKPVYTTAETKPVYTTAETGPVNTTAETELVNTAETESVNTTAETELGNTTAETGPVNTTAETGPVNTTVETGPVNTTSETGPVNTTSETGPVNTTAETEPVNTTAETEPVNITAETVPVNTTAETEPVNTTAETEPVNTTAETGPVNTTAETAPVNTTAETAPVYTTAETGPVNTTAETEPVYTTAETEPVNTTAKTWPVNATAETAPVNTTAETMISNSDRESESDMSDIWPLLRSAATEKTVSQNLEVDFNKENVHHLSDDGDDSCKDPSYSPSSDQGSESEQEECKILNGISLTSSKSSATSLKKKKLPDSSSNDLTKEDSSDDLIKEEEKVSIQVSQKRDGCRVYDKRQACLYCEGLFTKISDHMTNKHSSELEVSRIMAQKKGSTERKTLWYKIRNKGNFHHNLKVLNLHKGTLIVNRRPNVEKKDVDYTPCPQCLGFFLKEDLWRHIQMCPIATYVPDSARSVKYSSSLLLRSIMGPDQEFMGQVINGMKEDKILDIIKTDNSLLLFGSSMYRKVGKGRRANVRQKIRELARLLEELRINKDCSAGFTDFLKPNQFDEIIKAVLNLCINKSNEKTERGCPKFDKPSLALKLGHSLKKLAEIKRSQALRTSDDVSRKEAEDYILLHTGEWAEKVSAHAFQTLSERKFNEPDVLPLTEDIVNLRHYVLTEMKKLIDQIEKSADMTTWRTLALVTLCRLTVFNKRRGGETGQMLLSTYKSRRTDSVSNSEIVSSLAPIEQKLIQKLQLIEITGKRNRKVPVLLTADMIEAIDCMIKYRNEVGVPAVNKYLFAAPTTDNGYLKGWDALSMACRNCEMKKPELMKTTNLRKYVATVSQIVDLGSENELEWLANHMGHTISVHRNFYRLQEHTIELAKVSKLLIAVDRGECSKYAGKKLDDITLDELSYVSLDDEHEVAADDDHSKKDCLDDLRDQHESACGKQGDEVPALAGLQNEMNDEEIVTSDYLSSDEDRDIDTEDHNKSKSNVLDDTTKRKRNLLVTAHGTKTKKAKMGVDCDEDIDIEDHNKSKSNVLDDTNKRKRNLLVTAHGTEMKKAKMGVDCDEGRKKVQRNPWSEEDTKLVRKYFHYHIVKRSPPSKSDICLQGRKNEKVKCLIEKRGWKRVKYYVWSLAQQHDKKVKKLLK